MSNENPKSTSIKELTQAQLSDKFDATKSKLEEIQVAVTESVNDKEHRTNWEAGVETWNKKHNDNVDVKRLQELCAQSNVEMQDVMAEMKSRFEAQEIIDNTKVRKVVIDGKEQTLVPNLPRHSGLEGFAAANEYNSAESRKVFDENTKNGFYPKGGCTEAFDLDPMEFLNVTQRSATAGVDSNKPRPGPVVMRRDPDRTIVSRLQVFNPHGGGNTFNYPREQAAGLNTGQVTNAANTTAQGAEYKDQDMVATDVQSIVQKITAITTVTDELFQDVQVARQFVLARQRENIYQRLEDQGINGNGTAPNWDGLLDTTGIQVVTKTVGSSSGDLANFPYFDPFLEAWRLLSKNAYRMPSFVAMNATTCAGLARKKDKDNNYMWGAIGDALGQYIWGIEVVVSEHLADNEAIMLYEPDYGLLLKRGVEMEWGYNEDDFSKGLRSVRTQMRGNILSFRPNSLVHLKALGIADIA